MKRLIRYFRATQFENDLGDEIQAHLDERIDEYVRLGMTPTAAREKANRDFGNRTRVTEVSREQWGFKQVDEVMQDLRYAFRALRKNRSFTVVAVLSLALGIGANTVIFGAVNQVLLQPLPYPNAGRLVSIWSRPPLQSAEPTNVSSADIDDWRAQAHSFESLATYASWPMNLTNIDDPRRLNSELVSANFFSTLGVKPEIGRTFRLDEDQATSEGVIVISDRLWHAMGASKEIVGRQANLNGQPTTIIGVMPASFVFPSQETDAWVPLAMNAKNRADRQSRWLSVVGRLRPNVDVNAANADLNIVASHLATAYPATNRGWSTTLSKLQEVLVGKIRPILLIVQCGALLLLLIACANVANLLLARSASRTREIALRTAVGASRARILRQLVVENLLLASLGGSIGLALATIGIHLVRFYGETIIPRASEIHLSGMTVLFAVGATLLTTLIFGWVPILYASRPDIRSGVNVGAHGTPRSVKQTQGILVAIEVGLAAVLLVGTGLLGGSLAHLLSTPTGLQTDHLLSMRLTLSRSRYPTSAKQAEFFEKVLRSVEGLPGVRGVGEISDTPLEGNNPTFEFIVEGLRSGTSDSPTKAGLHVISNEYMRTANISLLEGRDFSSTDRSDGLPVAIINQTLSRQYWPGADPIGKRIRLKEDQRWMVVTGLVPDIKHMGLNVDEGPVLYIPYSQKTQDSMAWATLLVRTTGKPLDLAPTVRNAIHSIDPNQPIGEVSTIDDSLSRLTAMPRFLTTIVSVLSCSALLIAVIGVYGLLAYFVVQRMPELGIRMAVGGTPWQMLTLVLRQAMTQVVAGIIGGLTVAWVLSRFLESLLFGLEPHHLPTFVAVAFLLGGASVVAVIGPARRAMSVDPAMVLHAE